MQTPERALESGNVDLEQAATPGTVGERVRAKFNSYLEDYCGMDMQNLPEEVGQFAEALIKKIPREMHPYPDDLLLFRVLHGTQEGRYIAIKALANLDSLSSRNLRISYSCSSSAQSPRS